MKETYLIKSDWGKFKVRYNEDSVSLGGSTICITISSKGNIGWFETEKGGCEIDNKKVKGEYTVHFVNLAINIFHKYFPHIKYITLSDGSSYVCNLPDGNKKRINLMYANLLFHGKTYYEEKYGATLLSDDDIPLLEKFKNNRKDSKYKPKSFNFENQTLNEILTPLYEKNDTWEDFFKEIDNKFDKKKCEVIYGWYKKAVFEIIGTKSISEYWKIDINTIKKIKYERIKEGGKRKRTLKMDRKYIEEEYPFFNGFNNENLNYTIKYLHS